MNGLSWYSTKPLKELHQSGLTVSTIEFTSSGFIHLSPDVLSIIPVNSGSVSELLPTLLEFSLPRVTFIWWADFPEPLSI
jgi:hypothetical protein